MGVTVLTLGAGIDLSHMYLVRSELQAVADEAAIAAAGRLDGTDVGIVYARETAHRFLGLDRQPGSLASSAIRIEAARVEFAVQPGDIWGEHAVAARDVHAVRVTARAAARLFFVAMVPRMPSTQRVAATAVAALEPGASERRADVEFSVQAADDADPHHGFEAGGVYSLSAPDRERCRTELRRRLLEDTDGSSASYEEYARLGNGRRFLVVPVRSSAGQRLGHSAFLIPTGSRDSGACEAVFLGASPIAGFRRLASGPPGFYEVRLKP